MIRHKLIRDRLIRLFTINSPRILNFILISTLFVLISTSFVLISTSFILISSHLDSSLRLRRITEKTDMCFWSGFSDSLFLSIYVVDHRRLFRPQMGHLVVGQSVTPSAELVLPSNSFVFFLSIWPLSHLALASEKFPSINDRGSAKKRESFSTA